MVHRQDRSRSFQTVRLHVVITRSDGRILRRQVDFRQDGFPEMRQQNPRMSEV
jgi:hypothetical protein